MAEYLYHLLSGNGLLNVTVHGSDGGLLGLIIFPALSSHQLHSLKHQGDHHNRDQSQPYVGIEHQCKGTDNADGSGDQLYNGIVQHFPYCIHIIGKAAHHIPVIVGVIISHRKLLQLFKQLVSELLNGILGNADHDLLLQVLCQHCRHINSSHDADPLQKL